MFAWHETTWRGLCRLAFGLLVAVPTCAVLLAIVWCRCPLSVEYYRRSLAEQFALDVQLERVSFPRPHVTRYDGMSLSDPETARPLARFRTVEWQVSGQKSTVTCWQAELLDCSRLDLLTELVARRLRSLAGSPTVVEIQAPQLTMHLADGTSLQSLTDVRGKLQAESRGPQVQGAPVEPQGIVEFHMAGQKETAPARISFYRGSSEQGATASIKIETGPAPLPARLINLCCPGWGTWGPASNFCGELWWRQRADGPAGEVRGRVAGVDLDNLVSTRSEHQLSGIAEVQLDRARFQHGRLLDVTGSIHAGPGLVRRSLLAEAAQDLNATGNNSAAARDDLAAYDELAFSFAIDEHGLVIKGICSQSPGALFVGPLGPLLGEPSRRQSLLGVVRLLATSGQAVPADPAAQALLRVLPVPVAEPSGLDAEPHARLRKNPHR